MARPSYTLLLARLDGFVVQELAGGRSNVPFAFRIVALRKDVSAPRLRRVSLPEAAHVKQHVKRGSDHAGRACRRRARPVEEDGDPAGAAAATDRANRVLAGRSTLS